jgi:hypothetical protein
MANARQRARITEAVPTLQSIRRNASPELLAERAASRAMAEASGIRSARLPAAQDPSRAAAANAERLAAYLRVIDR